MAYKAKNLQYLDKFLLAVKTDSSVTLNLFCKEYRIKYTTMRSFIERHLGMGLNQLYEKYRGTGCEIGDEIEVEEEPQDYSESFKIVSDDDEKLKGVRITMKDGTIVDINTCSVSVGVQILDYFICKHDELNRR